MEEMLFLGVEGNVEPVQRRVWKIPMYIGTAILVAFTIYEIVKLCYFATSTAVIYVDYSAEEAMQIVNKTTALTAILLIMAIVIAVLVKASSSSAARGRVYWVMIIVAEIVLVMSAILAIVRFVVDVIILKSSTFPWYDIWIYRFMDGSTILMEWDVIPDILLNGALVLGIILVMVTLVEFYAEVDLHSTIMETGMDTKDEKYVNGNEKFKLDCKMKNGIKACRIK